MLRPTTRSLHLALLLAVSCATPEVACAQQRIASNPATKPEHPRPAASAAASPVAQRPSNPSSSTPGDAALGCPDRMALLPAGSFTLGVTGRKVKVEAFCIDKMEVTAGDYLFCVEVNRCSSAGLRGNSWGTYNRYDDHPVNYVTWEQARHYCEVHLERLPTEEEWEWAARGGPAGNKYPWGNDPPTSEPCWSGPGNDAPGEQRERTCQAGSHALDETPQGVLDMAGNLYEWTATRAGRGERIVRGGGWGTENAKELATSSRYPKEIVERSPLVGFRCVRPAEPREP